MHNVTGDNAGSQWIWFNMIDMVLFGTSKVDGVSGGMNNNEDVGVEETTSNST